MLNQANAKLTTLVGGALANRRCHRARHGGAPGSISGVFGHRSKPSRDAIEGAPKPWSARQLSIARSLPKGPTPFGGTGVSRCGKGTPWLAWEVSDNGPEPRSQQ